MRVAVGCPISDRSWVLDHWFDHIYTNFYEVGLDPEFIFVVPEWDQASIDLIKNRSDARIKFSGEAERKDERLWSNDRIQHLADIRNLLLDEVKDSNPDFFMSVDSDILLAKNALGNMLDIFEKYPDCWAAGSKCFLSSAGYAHPNMGWFINNGKYRREDVGTVVRVDILMAVKLMSRPAYNIPYVFHRNGEDLGWSENVKLAGGTFYWDGSTASKHVMKREMLDVFDRRIGF